MKNKQCNTLLKSLNVGLLSAGLLRPDSRPISISVSTRKEKDLTSFPVMWGTNKNVRLRYLLQDI